MAAAETASMGRKKIENPVAFTMCKLRSDAVDRARSMLFWVRNQLPEADRKGYMLQHYLSDCILEKRSLTTDYAAFIREEAKRLGK